LLKKEETRRPLKDKKQPPPPPKHEPLIRQKSTDSLESAFCLDSPPRTPMRTPKSNKPKYSEVQYAKITAESRAVMLAQTKYDMYQ
jgi:hypothetical protein